MRKYRALLSSIVFVFLALAVALPGAAAEICRLDQTEDECSEAVRVAVAERFGLDPDKFEIAPASEGRETPDTKATAEKLDKVENEQAVEALKRLLERNTGIDSAGLPSAVLDFLSKLGIDVDTSDEGTLALELNQFLGLPTEDGYQVRVLLKKAELYGPLVEKLPEASRSERKEALEKGLDDFDNAAFVLTYSPMTESLGRNPKIHSTYFADLFEAIKATDQIDGARYGELDLEQGKILGKAVKMLESRIEGAGETEEKDQLKGLEAKIESSDYTFAEIAEIDKELASKLLDVTEERETAWFERSAFFNDFLETTRFFNFADLVDNQPQLYANVEATARDELVGPDEIKAKITYEHGFVNVNKLRQYTKSCRERDPRTGDLGEKQAVLLCYREYLTPDKLTQLRRGDRLAFSLEYSDVKDYAVMVPDDAVSLEVAGDRKIVGSLVYGRYLDFTAAGRGQSRVDFSWSYEDVGHDPNRKDRSLVTLTYSQRAAGNMIFAAGVTWANEPEFRGDVDHEISARVGLTYKLFQDDKF